MSEASVALFDNTPVDFDPWKKNHVAEKKVRRENFWERLSEAYIALLAAGIVGSPDMNVGSVIAGMGVWW